MRQPSRIFRGKVEGGKLWIAGGRAQLDEYIKRFELKQVEVIVRRWRQKRTLSQNAWYWAVIVPMIAEAAGYEDTEEGHEETHEALKWRFLRRNNPERPIFGDSPQLLPAAPVRSSTSLDTVEMVEYCENCRRFAAQTWGLDIPDPKRAKNMGFCIE